MGETGTGEFEKRFRKQLAECGLSLPGGRVVAAVSGGADSVCLLALLEELFSRGEIELRAVHIHHGLREEEADRDARWVEELCRSMKVPCQIFYENVRDFAAVGKLSEEEAGRILRYRRLQEAAEAWEGQETGENVLIAAAHHQEDQAETILHNLCRGSGLKGMGGMEKKRGRLIRPLLEERRETILRWLEERGLTYCQDSTNASDHYTRNRIRGRLIPAIQNEVNEKGVENIARMGRMAALADDFLTEEAVRWLKERANEGCPGQPELFLPEESFLRLHRILQFYAVRLALVQVTGRQRDLTWLHAQETLGLFERQTGRRIFLPGGFEAVREYGGIRSDLIIFTDPVPNDPYNVASIRQQRNPVSHLAGNLLINHVAPESLFLSARQSDVISLLPESQGWRTLYSITVKPFRILFFGKFHSFFPWKG